MNNSVVWTIVGILAILALLIFIFGALGDGDGAALGVAMLH